ncbi:hypothetical protein ACVW0P_001449 [Mucilaginibacter sp. UYNi724]
MNFKSSKVTFKLDISESYLVSFFEKFIDAYDGEIMPLWESHKIVRLNVGAHRDEDGMLQAKIIDHISMELSTTAQPTLKAGLKH